jgi:tetratricopeptide (TPR) repeat protein
MKLGVGAFVLLFVALAGIQYAAAQEIPITTKSREAMKLFLDGRTLLENWHGAEAHKLFAEAVAKDPGFAMGHIVMADTAPDTKVFYDELKKAISLASGVTKAEQLILSAYQAAYLDNDPLKCSDCFRQLAEMYPNDKRAHFYYGANLRSRLEKDKAIAEYEKALALDKNFAPAHEQIAYTYLSKDDFGKAEEHFKILLQIVPKEPNPHDCLGDLYMKTGRFDEAISQYEQAVKLDPHWVYSQSKIGSAYIMTGRYEEGRKAFEAATPMRLQPAGKVYDQEGIARSYIYAGDFRKALEASGVAMRLARELGLPEEVPGLYLGNCMINCVLKNYAAAGMSIADCRKALQDPAIPPSGKQNMGAASLYWEVFVAAERKDFARAEAKLADFKADIAKINEPLFPKYAEWAGGFILLAKGEYAAADAQFTKANVDEPLNLYYAAMAKEKAGDVEGAKKLYARVANWNEDSLWYAFVRGKAKAKV